jgi:hypothetical protein
MMKTAKMPVGGTLWVHGLREWSEDGPFRYLDAATGEVWQDWTNLDQDAADAQRFFRSELTFSMSHRIVIVPKHRAGPVGGDRPPFGS